MACAGVRRAIGGITPKASAVSMMIVFGCGATPVALALEMKWIG